VSARVSGLRVLFVANRWPDEQRPWHGIAMCDQARSLRELGIEIDVIPIRGYAGRGAYLGAAVSTLRRVARRYDVVHAHYGHSGMVARLQLRPPLVVSYLGTDLLAAVPANGLGPRPRLEAAVFRQLARLAAATITQSREMERVLPRSLRARNTVIAEGVDMLRFAPADRTSARRELGWALGEPVILFVSDPRRTVKNFPLARAACDALAARLPGLRLHVAGDMTPADVPRYMNAADALIMTSNYEGGPSVVKEAMACALPVVATPVGILNEVLRGLPGIHVAAPEPAALAGALAMAIEGGRTPAAREAIAFMSLERVAERVAGVYAGVTGGGE